MGVARLTLPCPLGCKPDSSQEAAAMGTGARQHLASTSSTEAGRPGQMLISKALLQMRDSYFSSESLPTPQDSALTEGISPSPLRSPKHKFCRVGFSSSFPSFFSSFLSTQLLMRLPRGQNVIVHNNIPLLGWSSRGGAGRVSENPCPFPRATGFPLRFGGVGPRQRRGAWGLPLLHL